MTNQLRSALNKSHLWLAMLALVAVAAIYISNWCAALSSPYSINFEGPMLWAATALTNGQNVYELANLQHAPWITTIYPPVYLWFAALMVKVFGVHYWPLRLANMILCLAVSTVLFRLMRLSNCRLPACVCALVFFFSFDVMSVESFEVRPDYLLIFVSSLMLERFCSIYLRTKQKDSLRSFIPVLLLALAAICIKQQAIVFVAALILFLLAEGRIKLALQLFISWLLGLTMFTAMMQFISGGYLANLTFLAATKSSSSVLISNLAKLGLDWVKLIWALCVVPVGILAAKKLQGLQKLPFILATVSTLLFFFSMGIPASSTNHMMSALFALSWVLAICLDSLPGWVSIAGLIACCVSFPHLAEEAIYRPLLLPHARKDAVELKALHLEGKPVLTDDVNINFLTDSQPVLVDCATFLNVWSAQGSDFKQLIDPIKEKRYAAIIINSNDCLLPDQPIWWPRAVIQAVQQNYHKKGEVQCSGWSMDLFVPD